MKRGHIVARRRFINKYGKTIINSALTLSIMFCLGTFLYTSTPIFSNTKSDTVSASSAENGVKTVKIIDHTDNQVITEDGVRYFFEDANSMLNDGESENVSYSAVIVNGKCTAILTSVED